MGLFILGSPGCKGYIYTECDQQRTDSSPLFGLDCEMVKINVCGLVKYSQATRLLPAIPEWAKHPVYLLNHLWHINICCQSLHWWYQCLCSQGKDWGSGSGNKTEILPWAGQQRAQFCIGCRSSSWNCQAHQECCSNPWDCCGIPSPSPPQGLGKKRCFPITYLSFSHQFFWQHAAPLVQFWPCGDAYLASALSN